MREPGVKKKTDDDSPLRFPVEFGRRMERAASRCADISRSEKVLGYILTYRVYSDLAEECKQLPAWLFQEITRVSSSGSRWPSFDDAA